MKRKHFLHIALLLFMIFAVACRAPSVEPGAPLGGETPTPEDAEQVAGEALPAARMALASFLGLTPDEIELDKIEDAEWSNACLGLPGPDELCAEVMTPGYLMTFTVDGSSYAVRTDLEGGEVRVEAAAGQATGDERPAAVGAAVEALAQQLGITTDTIEVLSFSEMEWSDSCLGLGGPAESCAAVVTPGWEVLLGVDDQTYEVRTDADGEQVRIAGETMGQPDAAPEPDLSGAVLFFQRSGGIAGEVTTIRVYGNGNVERTVGGPGPETPVELMIRDASAVQTLLDELASADYFDLERSYVPEDTCCDRFLYLMSVEGEEGQHTVEALADTEDAPASLWKSIDLIETFVENAAATS